MDLFCGVVIGLVLTACVAGIPILFCLIMEGFVPNGLFTRKWGRGKALDSYLFRLAKEQTRRDEQGRLLLPKDDNPEDEELLPSELRSGK